MNCESHRNAIEFICTSQNCDYLTLCKQCRKQHLDTNKESSHDHRVFIIPIKKALETAQQNLDRNKKRLLQIIEPYKNQKKILKDIQQQKKRLKQQCQRIKYQIDNIFQTQIKQLDNRNKQIFTRNNQDMPIQQILTKIQQIDQLIKNYRYNNKVLKKSLIYSLGRYISDLGRNRSQLSSIKYHKTNQYYLYDDIKHDFIISRLNLHKRNISGKPLTKIYNQSPLYFLINKNTSDTLFYFSISQKLLRTYNVKKKKWKSIGVPQDISLSMFGCNIHDPQADRFYHIGGTKDGGNAGVQFLAKNLFGSSNRSNISSNKNGQIIWYDRKTFKWNISNTSLNIPRSSAMCVLLHDYPSNNILIVGGLDNQGHALKSCQIYNPQTDSIKLISETNFGTSSGTLVNFNNIIFKIGGLGNYQKNHAICQIIQKFDYQKYKLNQNIKWNYIQLEDIKGHKDSDYKLYYAGQAAIQINPNQVFIFGGCNHNNVGTRQSYIMEVQTITTKQQRKNTRYYARWINQKPLLTGQSFLDLKPVIWDNKLYCLENISMDGNNNNQILQKQKKILQFDMYEWYETQCVIDN